MQIRLAAGHCWCGATSDPASGVGHLMRCIALAEEFAARGHEVVFSATVEDVPFALEQVAAAASRGSTRRPRTAGLARAAARVGPMPW